MTKKHHKLAFLSMIEYCYISALVLICFCLTNGRAKHFRHEIIVASLWHLMLFLFKALFSQTSDVSPEKCYQKFDTSQRGLSDLQYPGELYVKLGRDAQFNENCTPQHSQFHSEQWKNVALLSTDRGQCCFSLCCRTENKFTNWSTIEFLFRMNMQ